MYIYLCVYIYTHTYILHTENKDLKNKKTYLTYFLY